MKNKIVLMIFVAVLTGVIMGGAGFFVGMKYQQNQRQNFNRSGFAQTNNRMMGNNRPVAGEIIAVDDKSITVKLTDGSSKIIMFGSTVSINKAETKGAVSDLKVGTKVSVFGSTNTDGSVTAQNIQLLPQPVK